MIGVTADTAAPLLRRGLLWLAGLTIAALALELAIERHWTQPVQWIAWGALAVAGAALWLASRNPTPAKLGLARILAVAVVLSGVYGIWTHVESNYDAGELDQRYMATWETLPEPTRWWLALSKTVGPSPVLAPGALAQAGFCILLASAGRPGNRE